MATAKMMTLADIDGMGPDFDDFEVIDGVLVERETMSWPHGRIGFDLGFFLALHVKTGNLGELVTSDTNFVLGRDPLVIVKPDVAFVRSDRLPSEGEGSDYLRLVPDIVVEVVSPSDRTSRMMTKIERYRQAGVPLIWLVWPNRRTVTVYAAGHEPRTVGADGELDGGEVLPGFRLKLSEIFR